MKGIVGEVVHKALAEVQPNPWNPNHMTAFEKESLKHGLRHDGWLSSQSLLVWGTDERGRKKNLIIDGEHRHTVAVELGFTQGPMVFLQRVTEAEAKALTVKMNGKRGTPDRDELSELLRSIQHDLTADSMSLDLGIEDEKLMALLAEAEVEDPLANVSKPDEFEPLLPGGKASHVKMVQLFFDPEQHEEFHTRVKALAARYKTNNVTETVMEHLRRAAAPASK